MKLLLIIIAAIFFGVITITCLVMAVLMGYEYWKESELREDLLERREKKKGREP